MNKPDGKPSVGPLIVIGALEILVVSALAIVALWAIWGIFRNAASLI